MKKFYLATACAFMTLSALANVAATPRNAADDLFRFAPKAKAELRDAHLGDPAFVQNLSGQTKSSALSIEASATLPKSDKIGFLNSPTGETWFYTLDYVEADGNTGFKITVFDTAYNELGQIEDYVELTGDETKVADFSVGADVTRKFFNYDNNYELMVGVATNTSRYVNNYRTRVYSIETNEFLQQIDGYYCSAINTASDAWSENFYITFLTYVETETPEVNGIENDQDYLFLTYTKAGYSGGCSVAFEARFPGITIAGSDAIPFLSTCKDGIPYFSVSHLKYSWYEDPFDYTNDNPTADNELIVDLYYKESSWSSTIVKYSTTTFPLDTTIDDLYFLYVGNFMYDDDINLTLNADGTPAIYLTRAHTTRGGDEFIYDYEVYDAAPKGETAVAVKKFELAQGVGYGTFMRDIAGYDPQVMFIYSDDDVRFDFVNILTGELEHSLGAVVEYEDLPLSLTSSTDRIANGNSYLYFAPQTQGASDDEGNMHTGVVFVDPETGEAVRCDDVNMGPNVDYAQLYTGIGAFDPYLFNLDDKYEYMALVKRRNDDGNGNHEELLVLSANTVYTPILVLGPDDQKGNLASITFVNLESDKPGLVVMYLDRDDNWKITLDSYDLPLTFFEEGDGTIGNPYQITTAGGLRQIKKFPAAHYIIANDIDAAGTTIENSSFVFSGSLNGMNHIISNLTLSGYALLPQVRGNETTSEPCYIFNIRLLNPRLEASASDQGIIVGTVSTGYISNIHAYNAYVASDGDVAGLVGRATLNTVVEQCSFNGSIVAPESLVGGIVGTTLTGSSVKACAFKGSIEGGTSVGGILGNLGNYGGTVTDCHVNADIKARNTVGGIVGYANRNLIARNHVQGTIEATTNMRWGGGAKVGGVVGSLQPDYSQADAEEGAEPVLVVTDNFVNLASITVPEITEGEYPSQNTTAHRVVGYSGANIAEEIGYDEETWEPIYGDPLPADNGIANNYVIDTLPVIDTTIEDNELTTEGKSIESSDLGLDFFMETLNFAYGYDVDSPWSMTGDSRSPRLFFEGGLLLISPAEASVEVDEEVVVVLSLVGEELTEDLLGGFTCDYDEALVELNNMELTEDGIALTFKGLAEGSATVSAGLAGQTAQMVITVTKSSSGIIEAEVLSAISYNGAAVSAEGCAIEVYNIAGTKVLGGNDVCDVTTLRSGVYIATATAADGQRSVLKFCVK